MHRGWGGEGGWGEGRTGENGLAPQAGDHTKREAESASKRGLSHNIYYLYIYIIFFNKLLVKILMIIFYVLSSAFVLNLCDVCACICAARIRPVILV